jgi:hypothetical protein
MSYSRGPSWLRGVHEEESMQQADLVALLTRARAVLERYLFEADGEAIRDDVAEICMAIDDALPDEERVRPRKAELDRSMLERSAA